MLYHYPFSFCPLFVFVVDFWTRFLNSKGFYYYCIRTGSVQLSLSFLLFFLWPNFWLSLISFYLWWFYVIFEEEEKLGFCKLLCLPSQLHEWVQGGVCGCLWGFNKWHTYFTFWTCYNVRLHFLATEKFLWETSPLMFMNPLVNM